MRANIPEVRWILLIMKPSIGALLSKRARIPGMSKRLFRFGAVDGRSVAGRDGYKDHHLRFT